MTHVGLNDFNQQDWSAGRSYLSMGCWRGEHGRYRESVFRHPLAIVEVYEQIGGRPHTSMRLRHAGRDYCRSWQANWGDRTIARLAREFIEDVIAF